MMATSISTLPAPHELVAEAIRFGLPEPNRHGFQAVVERWLGMQANGRPKAPTKASAKGRAVSWKAYGPMRQGSCGQCGDGADYRFGKLGGHSALCSRCFAVLERSRKYWIPNPDFPSAG